MTTSLAAAIASPEEVGPGKDYEPILQVKIFLVIILMLVPCSYHFTVSFT